MADQSSPNPPEFWQRLIVSDSNDHNGFGLISHYPVEQVLFADDTRAVFQTIDDLTDRPILLAIFHSENAQLENARLKLLPGHDFLYPVHEVLEISGHPALVLPCLAGLSLAEILKNNHQFTIAQTLKIMTEVLVALSVGHFLLFFLNNF